MFLALRAYLPRIERLVRAEGMLGNFLADGTAIGPHEPRPGEHVAPIVPLPGAGPT